MEMTESEYKYIMRHRPFGIGCQPKGFTKVDNANFMIDGYYNILAYPEKLSDEQVYQFELKRL